MSRWVKCDNCGEMKVEPYRLTFAEKEEARAARKDEVVISLEHDDDAQNFDACSWACVAEIALRQAAENATADQEGMQS